MLSVVVPVSLIRRSVKAGGFSLSLAKEQLVGLSIADMLLTRQWTEVEPVSCTV